MASKSRMEINVTTSGVILVVQVRVFNNTGPVIVHVLLQQQQKADLDLRHSSKIVTIASQATQMTTIRETNSLSVIHSGMAVSVKVLAVLVYQLSPMVQCTVSCSNN